MEITYLTGALKAEQLPELTLPEVGIVGRSNCGKSTLINAFFSRKAIARTSRTPGRTQLIHFFSVSEEWIIADLPGYGFSKASKEIARNWQPLVDAYLQRRNLVSILFLMDVRRPLEDSDRVVLSQMRHIPKIIVGLTKADKCSPSEAEAAKKKVAAELGKRFKNVEVIAVSSKTKKGLEELREKVALAVSEVP
ncbi:MAG: ribosome biogenesis GTP-binding protein YihA/YsxC [Oligoflexales bacterium]